MAVLSLIVGIYYNVVMAYTLYYMFASWQSVLPWTTCDSEWAVNDNTTQCYERSADYIPPTPCKELIEKNITNLTACTNATYQTSMEQYWE